MNGIIFRKCLITRAIYTSAAVLMLFCLAAAQSGSILYNFSGGNDGGFPKARLLLDKAGNLYGTTTSGGAHGQGAVFELSPGRSGWTEQVLYSFQGGGDGSLPAAGVISDKKGNLYGTLYMGGAMGHGAVFELVKPGQGGSWTNQLLYSFTGGNDGGQPVAGLIFDKKGNLYGNALLDGQYGQGVVFELSPGLGSWTETVLHAFVSQSPDAQGPGGSLIFDKKENLYGLTVQGGSFNKGAAYELSPNGDGTWTESVIYSFQGGNDGAYPATTDLLLKGNGLYGTTTNGGGAADAGTVFQLIPSKSGWIEKVLYSFPSGASGGNPYAGVVADSSVNLYGTTASGVHGAGGVVFKLTKGKPVWTETVLYTFDNPGNGSYADLIRDKAGKLYGTTEFGGPQFSGSVFEVTP